MTNSAAVQLLFLRSEGGAGRKTKNNVQNTTRLTRSRGATLAQTSAKNNQKNRR